MTTDFTRCGKCKGAEIEDCAKHDIEYCTRCDIECSDCREEKRDPEGPKIYKQPEEYEF